MFESLKNNGKKLSKGDRERYWINNHERYFPFIVLFCSLKVHASGYTCIIHSKNSSQHLQQLHTLTILALRLLLCVLLYPICFATATFKSGCLLVLSLLRTSSSSTFPWRWAALSSARALRCSAATFLQYLIQKKYSVWSSLCLV